eukprot:Pgem_evm1s15119
MQKERDIEKSISGMKDSDDEDSGSDDDLDRLIKNKIGKKGAEANKPTVEVNKLT